MVLDPGGDTNWRSGSSGLGKGNKPGIVLLTVLEHGGTCTIHTGILFP